MGINRDILTTGVYCFAARYTKLQEQYNDAFKAMQEQKQLIAQLEEDLRSVNALSSMFRGDAEVTCRLRY